LSGELEEKLFARKSSGLIKEASSTQATIWNIANIMAVKFPWSVAFLGLFPAGLILGWSPYIWVTVVFGLASYVLGIIYIQITTPMPRSGADYVIPARLMGPFWGWINSWMLMWSWIPIWGFNGWVAVRNIKQFVDILKIAGVNTANVSWMMTNTSIAAVVGSVVVILGMLLCLLPPRRYYYVIAILGGLGLLSLLLVALGTAFANPATFAQNMKSLVGVTPDQVVTTATNSGFDPNGGYTFVTAAGLGAFVMWAMGGFQYSATISGELRGDVKKNLTTSILGSLTFYLIFVMGFIWFVLVRFGYNFTLAWSYLFWNTNSAPLGLPPINALLTVVAEPGLWPIWAIAGIAGVFATWIIVPASMVYVNRLVIGWGIDRMVPKSFSEVHPKFRQPLKIVFFEGLVAVLFYLALLYFNFNPLNYAYWSILMTFTAMVFPAVCGLLMPRRRPDLYQNAPWRRWLVPMSALWLAFIIPFYLWAGVIGSVPPMTPGLSVTEYALSTGLLATFVVIVAGIIFYLVAHWYNLKQGIDLKQLFQRIPPE
jgi:APA family basic amino acid/polyamine antiporter